MSRLVIFSVLIILFEVFPAAAQSPVRISGYVFATDGEPLKGASVIVDGTNYADAADAWGAYEIVGVPPGSYSLRCRLIGYKPAVRSEVPVKIGVTTKVNFHLSPDTLLLREITVTAEKAVASLAELAPSVVVISNEEIQRSSAQTLARLLESVPGVFVKSYGPAGAQQSVSIRGSESNQVLLLLDGQRFTSAQNGAADLSAIPLASIESVEILKGGASALFGSNAVAGVINVRSKSGTMGKKWDISQQSSFGSFATRELAAQLGHSGRHLKYNFAFDWLASDSDFEFVNTARASKPMRERTNADYQSYNGFAKLQWILGQRSLLEVAGQVYDLTSGTPGEIANPTPLARSRDTRYLSRVSFQSEISAHSHATVTGFYNVYKNRFSDPELSYLNGRNENVSLGFDSRHTRRFAAAHQVTVGLSFARDEVTGTNISGQPVRNNLSVFVQDQIKLHPSNGFVKSATLYPALRFDHFSEFGTEVSPKLGLLLADLLIPNLSLKANLGRSFRVPSFNSLFFISSVQVRSNPNLSPERSFDFDIGLNVRLSDSRFGKPEFDLSYFRRNVDGTILWLPDFQFVWSPRNISKVVSQGVEASAYWCSQDDEIYVGSKYTFTDARFDLRGNDNPVPYRPKHQLGLEVGFQLFRIAANFSQRWVSERFPNVAATNAMSGYALADFNLSTRVAIGKLSLRPKFVITNLFAKDYQVVSNFPMSGREFRISLTTNY